MVKQREMLEKQQKRPTHIKFDDQGSHTQPSQNENSQEEKDLDASQLEQRELAAMRVKIQELSEEEKNALAAEKLKKVIKKQIHEKNDQKSKSYVDRVNLGMEGWKLRYYKDKFHVKEEDLSEFLKKIKQSYIEGLLWVYSYYYKGCVSWYWFYPYHYAPFASDLINCDRVQVKFEMGEPAAPFEQLMAVLPKQSSHALPPLYRHLLSSPDSEIIDFYPIDFKLDINGARFAWMGVNLLPFIERERLTAAMSRVEKEAGEAGLSPHDRERNKPGANFLFMRGDREKEIGALINLLIKNDYRNENLEIEGSYKRYDLISGNVKGFKNGKKIDDMVSSPYKPLNLSDIFSNKVL